MNRIAKFAIDYAKRRPYSGISDYMERLWLVPYEDATAGPGCGPLRFKDHPVAWCFQKLGIAIRVHVIKRSDEDRHLHDHPWANVSIILSGSYIEVKPMRQDQHPAMDAGLSTYVIADPGSIRFRKATDRHRLLVNDGEQAVSIFIAFKKQQSWGFYTPTGKVYWKDYLRINP